MENKELKAEKGDLEQMKSELDSLKYILSEKLRVEDAMIRQSMTGRQRDINRRIGAVMALGVLSMLLIPWSFWQVFAVSTAFMVVTELMLLGLVVLTAVESWAFRRLNFVTADLVQAAQVVSKLRRRYANWPKIGLPLAFCWFAWLLWEIYQADSAMALTIGGGCLLGGVIGGACGLRINRSIVSDADDVLAQIADLQR